MRRDHLQRLAGAVARFARWLFGTAEPATVCPECYRGIHIHNNLNGECLYADLGCECPRRSR